MSGRRMGVLRLVAGALGVPVEGRSLPEVRASCWEEIRSLQDVRAAEGNARARAEGEREDAAAELVTPGRACACGCGKRIPPDARRDKETFGVACRKRMERRRKRADREAA